MQAVILAAGKGTRLVPITNTTSKAMISIVNKPLLEWTIDAVKGVCDEIIIVIRKEQKDIIESFPDYKFVYQDETLGTAHAIAQCEKMIKGNFIVLAGDIIVHENEIKKFVKSGAPGICAAEVENPKAYGTLSLAGNLLKKITEKIENPESNLVNASVYFFTKDIFSAIGKTKKSERGEYEITDSINLLIENGAEFKCHILETWLDIGQPWQILDANKIILEKTGTIIGKNVQLRPGAFIEHPVAIDDNSIIGPNCYIRKFSSIGKNCKVGNAVEIKNSIIMDNSFVSHLSYVGDSVIGKNCNIAAGTLFANLRLDEKNIWMIINDKKVDSGHRKLGSLVGDNVKFGANCTIMPGKRIWPNILVPPCSIVSEDITVQPDIKEYFNRR